MQYVIALLLIIAVSEVTRLVLTHMPTTKKSYFKRKLKDVSTLIWDLEFKVFKTREVREDVRKAYDRAKMAKDAAQKTYDEWPKGGDQGERERVKDKITLFERDITRYELQMKSIDAEIDGEKPSADNPDGTQGINYQIDSLQEVKGMLKDWLKRI